MKRPSFLNKHRTKNGYELNTSTSSSLSNTSNNNKNSNNTDGKIKEKDVVFNSIAVLCHESKSHTKKHNRSSSSNSALSPHDVPPSSSSNHVDGGIVSQSSIGNCGLVLPTHADLAESNADEIVLNSTTILNNISLEDSYSTSEEGGKVLPSSVAVFVDDLILCGTSCEHSKESTSVQTVNGKEVVEGGEVSPTNVTEFNVSFGSADFDYFVDNRFSADDDDEQEKKTKGETKKEEKKQGEYVDKMGDRKETEAVRYTMTDDKTNKGGKMPKKKEGNTNKSSFAEFSNTFNDDTFSISLASTANNSTDTSSYTVQDFLHRASIDSGGVSSASQQYINEHIQILLDTILLPASILPIPKSVKDEVSTTILPAFASTANDVTDNIELILTLPADFIVNALSTSNNNADQMKKKVVKSNDMSSSVSSFMNSVNAGYESVSKSKSKGNVSSSLLNESNISNETIKTSNLLYCGSGSSCIERDFLYNTCVDQ